MACVVRFFLWRDWSVCLLVEEGEGEAVGFIGPAEPAAPELRVLFAGAVEGFAPVPEAGEERAFPALPEVLAERGAGGGSHDAVDGERGRGSFVVEGALEYFGRVRAVAVEVVVAQVEFYGGVSATANPRADGSGVVPDVAEAGLPCFGSFALLKEGAYAVEDGWLDAVADAADFPRAAFVGGGEFAYAEGGGAGGAVVFKAKDFGGEGLFERSHGFAVFRVWNTDSHRGSTDFFE